MANQTIAKPLGLIMDLQILVHGIPYAVTFIVIQSSVLDSLYSMVLGYPWSRDAKMSHDWGNNTITIQGPILLELYMLLRNLGHQPSIQKC
jgi:hypothetical protein